MMREYFVYNIPLFATRYRIQKILFIIGFSLTPPTTVSRKKCVDEMSRKKCVGIPTLARVTEKILGNFSPTKKISVICVRQIFLVKLQENFSSQY